MTKTNSTYVYKILHTAGFAIVGFQVCNTDGTIWYQLH